MRNKTAGNKIRRHKRDQRVYMESVNHQKDDNNGRFNRKIRWGEGVSGRERERQGREGGGNEVDMAIVNKKK